MVPTIDCFTWGGSVKLAHEDQTVVERDYRRIHELEMVGGGLFECDAPSDPAAASAASAAAADLSTPRDAVVVVDPVSWGLCLAVTSPDPFSCDTHTVQHGRRGSREREQGAAAGDLRLQCQARESQGGREFGAPGPRAAFRPRHRPGERRC